MVWIGDSQCWAKVAARARPALGTCEAAVDEAQGRRAGVGLVDWARARRRRLDGPGGGWFRLLVGLTAGAGPRGEGTDRFQARPK
jgi:hypothetical protein